MRKLIAAVMVAGALALSGCATIQGALGTLGTIAGVQVTQNQIDALENGYVLGLQVWIKGYVQNYRTNPCAKGQRASLADPCSEYSIAIRLQALDRQIDTYFDQLEADFAACAAGTQPAVCSGLRGIYSLAQSSIAAAREVARTFGYGGG